MANLLIKFCHQAYECNRGYAADDEIETSTYALNHLTDNQYQTIKAKVAEVMAKYNRTIQAICANANLQPGEQLDSALLVGIRWIEITDCKEPQTDPTHCDLIMTKIDRVLADTD